MVVGGWRYLWKEGGVGAWGLAVCACLRARVWCLWGSFVWRWCSVRWIVRGLGGGGPAPGVRFLEGQLRLVEQEFEEVGLVFAG